MSVEFLDGFAHYVTTNMSQKWTFPSGTITSSPPAGRIGPGLQLPVGGNAGITLSHQSAWVAGFAVYFNGAPATYNGFVYNASHAGQVELIRLRLESDATLSILTANSGVLIANTTPFSFHDNTWYYLECKYNLSGGTATPIQTTATVRIDGSIRASGTGTCGFNTTALLLQTPTINAHGIANPVVNGNTYIKDLYIFDQGSTDTNDFAGDCTFVFVVPDGDVTTGWDLSSGSVSFSLVNEVPPDGDTSYVQSSNTGTVINSATDNFTWQDIPAFTGTIVAVQYLGFLRKTGEGKKSVKLTVGPSGGFTQVSEEFFLNDNYLYYRLPMGTDPATGVTWTQSGFNATDFGIEVIS